jgi:proline utilization trans-activator
VLTNTLVASEPQIRAKRYGQPSILPLELSLGYPADFFFKAYLGHSSTLPFSKNVRNLLQQSTSAADPNGVSIEHEDVSYATALPSIGLDLENTPLFRLQYASMEESVSSCCMRQKSEPILSGAP